MEHPKTELGDVIRNFGDRLLRAHGAHWWREAKIIADQADDQIAAAEARGRKQAAHDIAAEITEEGETYPDSDGFGFLTAQTAKGAFKTAADIARAYAAGQDTG